MAPPCWCGRHARRLHDGLAARLVLSLYYACVGDRLAPAAVAAADRARSGTLRDADPSPYSPAVGPPSKLREPAVPTLSGMGRTQGMGRMSTPRRRRFPELGRASSRDRVCPYV